MQKRQVHKSVHSFLTLRNDAMYHMVYNRTRLLFQCEGIHFNLRSRKNNKLQVKKINKKKSTVYFILKYNNNIIII